MDALQQLHQPTLGTITSPATVDALFHGYPAVNRIILRHVEGQKWELVKCGHDRPTDLKHIAQVTNGYYGYERSAKRGLETLTGYDIEVDATFKVIYRLQGD
jgi:hypothetical protein